MNPFDHLLPYINDLALGKAIEPVRNRVASAARGRVLEIGAGTGLNFRHYPRDVDLVAIEPSPIMRSRAQRQARSSPSIQLLDANATSLPFPNETFDTVVITFVLCSVKDLSATLHEVHRVLRPHGSLCIAEHVVHPDPRTARWQHRIEPIWKIVLGGCHITRDIRHALTQAHFETSTLDDIPLPLPRLVSAGIVGTAVRRQAPK